MNKNKGIATESASTVGQQKAKSRKAGKNDAGNDGFGFTGFVSVRRGHIIMLVIGTFIAGLYFGWSLAAAAFRYHLWN